MPATIKLPRFLYQRSHKVVQREGLGSINPDKSNTAKSNEYRSGIMGIPWFLQEIYLCFCNIPDAWRIFSAIFMFHNHCTGSF
jgi:hypothetical protein